ncbi:MAG: hypothetical protein IJE09_05105, partial [Oscillospiraceae bacterium]|nr:hypothetical protein [Oscillospiraceae bacterium]
CELTSSIFLFYTNKKPATQMSCRFVVDDTRLELAGAGRFASGIRCFSAAQARLKQPPAVSSQVRYFFFTQTKNLQLK